MSRKPRHHMGGGIRDDYESARVRVLLGTTSPLGFELLTPPKRLAGLSLQRTEASTFHNTKALNTFRALGQTLLTQPAVWEPFSMLCVCAC